MIRTILAFALFMIPAVAEAGCPKSPAAAARIAIQANPYDGAPQMIVGNAMTGTSSTARAFQKAARDERMWFKRAAKKVCTPDTTRAELRAFKRLIRQNVLGLGASHKDDNARWVSNLARHQMGDFSK